MKIVAKTHPLASGLKKSLGYSKTMSTVVFIAVAVIFSGVAAAMFVGYGYTEQIGMLICAIFLTALGAVFPVLVLTVFMPYIRRRQREMLEIAYVSVVYIFSDDSVKRTQLGIYAHSETEIEYTSLSKVTETAAVFILFTENSAEMRIPKSDIIEGSADELAARLKSVLGGRYYKA